MAEIVRLKPVRPCPICGRPSSQLFHPFCSGRCQDIDLNRWLSGSYVIPAADELEHPGGQEGDTSDEDEV